MSEIFQNTFWKQLNTSLPLLTLLGLALFTIGRPLLFSSGPLPGPDSPYYLIESNKIYNSKAIENPTVDRNIVILLPSMISDLTNVDVQRAISFMVVVVFLLQVTGVYLITSEVSSNKWGLLAGVIFVFTKAGYRLYWDLYANAFGFTVLLYCFYLIILIIKKSDKSKEIILFPCLGLLLGTLFQIHGIVAISGTALVAAMLVTATVIKEMSFIGLVSFRKLLSFLFLFGAVFCVGQPLTNKIGYYVFEGIFQPLINKYIKQSETLTDNQYLVNWVDNSSYSLFDFPLNKDTYLFYFSNVHLLLLILAILAQPMVIKTLRQEDKAPYISFLLVSFLFFLLTQQSYFGLSWTPDRFIYGLASFTPVLIAMSLRYLFSILLARYNIPLINRKLLFYLFLLFLFYKLSYEVSQYLTFHFIPTTSPEEYAFLAKSSTLVEPHSVIFTSSLRHYWTAAMNTKNKVIPAEYYAICRNEEVRKRLDETTWKRGLAFSDAVTVQESIDELYSAANNKYYVILSVDDVCVNVPNFINDRYKEVYASEKLRLLQLK